MKIGRFANPRTRETFYASVQGGCARKIKSPLDPVELEETALDGLEVLAPSEPTKIVAVGLNYRRHAEGDMNMSVPEDPVLFLKPPSSILPHGGKIRYPDMARQVDYEAELGVVIGRTAYGVSENEAASYILGYTAFNDVTARDLQGKDVQYTRAKGFDTFSPFGPFVNTAIGRNPQDLRVQAVLNGKVVQDSRTSNMIFNIYYLVSFISRVMTLYPGDVIATGTPEGIGPMNKGDEIIIRIEGLNDLVNMVE